MTLFYITLSIVVPIVGFALKTDQRLKNLPSSDDLNGDVVEAIVDSRLKYEWVSRPRYKIPFTTIFIAGGVLLLTSYLIGIGYTLFTVIYIFAVPVILIHVGMMIDFSKTYYYRIRQNGLYKRMMNEEGDYLNFNLLFLWNQLDYIIPTGNGFRYFKGTEKGWVSGGDNPSKVITLVQARGVPTSPPDRPQSEQ